MTQSGTINCPKCSVPNRAGALFCIHCGQEISIEIFLAYSRDDEATLNKLIEHLSSLTRNNRVKIWYDRLIPPGAEWETVLNDHLLHAEIILLLISSSFIHSDYCYTKEMKEAIERHERKEAHVFPVIVRPASWHGAPFGKLQALPKDGKPIKSWSNPDDALLDVVESIEKFIKNTYKF